MSITPKELLARYISQAEMSSFFIDNMGIVNVKNYGVVADTTDSSQTTKINDAIDAAIDNGSQVVFFPSGVYYAGTALTSDSTSVIFVGDGASFSTQGSTYAVYQIWTPSIRTINNIEHHNGDVSIVAGSSDITVTATSSYTVELDISSAIKSFTTTLAQHTSAIATLESETTNLRTDLNAHTTDTSKHLNIMTASGDIIYNSTAGTPVPAVLAITGGKYLRSTTDAVPKPAWQDGPGADGAWESIASTVLASTALAVTFSGISTSYNRLQFCAVVRAAFSGSSPKGDVLISFNGDTAANKYYYSEQFGDFTANVVASTKTSGSIVRIQGLLTERSTNYAGGVIHANITNLASTEVCSFGQMYTMDICNPSTVDQNEPVFRKIYGAYKQIGSDVKITSISFTASTQSFAAGSYFSLWGA